MAPRRRVLNIDVEKALSTLLLPPNVCFHILPVHIKTTLKQRVPQECGPGLRPVLCPLCRSNRSVWLRYYNNRKVCGQLQPRFRCRACHDIEFTLHPGGGPPVISKKNPRRKSAKPRSPSPYKPCKIHKRRRSAPALVPRNNSPEAAGASTSEAPPLFQSSGVAAAEEYKPCKIPRRPRSARRRRERQQPAGSSGSAEPVLPGTAAMEDEEELEALLNSGVQHLSLDEIFFKGLDECPDDAFYAMPMSDECIGHLLGPIFIATSLDI